MKLIKTDIKGSNWLVSIPELLSKLFVFLDISDEPKYLFVEKLFMFYFFNINSLKSLYESYKWKIKYLSLGLRWNRMITLISIRQVLDWIWPQKSFGLMKQKTQKNTNFLCWKILFLQFYWHLAFLNYNLHSRTLFWSRLV